MPLDSGQGSKKFSAQHGGCLSCEILLSPEEVQDSGDGGRGSGALESAEDNANIKTALLTEHHLLLTVLALLGAQGTCPFGGGDARMGIGGSRACMQDC